MPLYYYDRIILPVPVGLQSVFVLRMSPRHAHIVRMIIPTND